ncbi:c-type cytochrome [Kaistella flava (ex Peng et al. 2021)]|uniref:C-type cytochrome n=1 Tax=Kaistella flava (ex Peng et al. 2021) TaxID=2038776 RepID=A0A7M2Y9K2_9FLAO|nr:cbb3-type cytochrome c oxidase subunit II [Kaistella flava (ex Peng et al. 2021)]QOW10509.1 c-type cytochrome [Kaistella flava (ex Peng et al. 2021)]
MEFLNNHKTLFWSALILFLFLTLQIAILPAITMQQIYKPLPDAKPFTKDELAGKAIYVENGCIACHTQQVREVEMDKVFGSRPSIPADYARNHRMDVWRNTANLLGSERTGPDLTAIGERQPSVDWQLLHLYQPRAVVKESIMPSYAFLFEEKDYLEKGDTEVKVPAEFLKDKFKKVVATKKALQLVAYLLSLKQTKLPQGVKPVDFLYKTEVKKTAAGGAGAAELPDGGELFTANCASCHQETGEGLPGAFPPLKGSPIVGGDDIDVYATIIMTGYTGRPGYGPMPSVGKNANFTPEMVTAIMNHERSSWGNNAKPVTLEQVKAAMAKIK